MRQILLPALVTLLFAPAADGQPVTARDVLRAHIEAAGGEEAFRAVTSRYARGEVTLDTQVGPVILDFEQMVAFPGHALVRQTAVTAPPEIPAEMLKQTIFITPDGGWIEAAQFGGRVAFADLPETQRSAFEQQRRSLAGVSDELELLGNDTLQVTLGPPDTLNGVPVHVLEIPGDFPSRRMYSAESGLLVGAEATGPMGRSAQYFSDYRTVSGIRAPFAVEMEQFGQAMTVSFSVIAFDRGLTPESLRAASEEN
jgi:hypothetical protein